MKDVAAHSPDPVRVHARPAQRFQGIEALRGLAAAAVVLSHAARHVDKAFGTPALIRVFEPGHAGVDLFFVLSGFIILFVHRRDVGRPARLGHYALRRFTRVMPLYWIALGLTIAMGAMGRGGLPPLSAVLRSASLLPSVQEPLLGVAWTLQFEVAFYSVFAVLIVSRAAGAALFLVWFAWIVALASGAAAGGGALTSVSSVFALEFFMGMAAALWVEHRRVQAPWLVAAGGGVLFLLAWVLEGAGILDGFGGLARFAYGLPATLLVLGIAADGKAREPRLPRWLRTLGAASYSIYLFQFVFIGPVWQGWLAFGLDRHLPPAACFVVLSAAATVGGVLVARGIEQPLLALTRGRGVRGTLAGRPNAMTRG